MKNDNSPLIEQELMEAFLLRKDDVSIGMPDIDSELQLVRMRAKESTSQNLYFWRVASVAASITLLIGISWYVNFLLNQNQDICVAYVSGKRITDEKTVMRMMADEIRSMNDNCDIIDGQLNVFFNE